VQYACLLPSIAGTHSAYQQGIAQTELGGTSLMFR